MSKEAQKLINKLLDRFEATPDRQRDVQQRFNEDNYGRLDLPDMLEFLKHAEKAGVVKLEMGKCEKAHILTKVRLADYKNACAFVGRTPSREIASTALAQLQAHAVRAPDWVGRVLDAAKDPWSRGKQAFGFSAEQVQHLIQAITVVQAVEQGKHEGLDIRTFSKRILGDSKAIPKLEGQITRLCRFVFDLEDELDRKEVFEAIGLYRLPHPVLVSGPLALKESGATLSGIQPYIGLPPGSQREIMLAGPPRYVLTIENLASFARHVTEIRDGGLVLYTAGYPSKAVAAFIRHFSLQTSIDIPWFHWGDIDKAGVLILEQVSKNADREVIPHLMTRELAEAYGTVSKTKQGIPRLVNASHVLGDLARFLEQKDAKTLEQEALDPISPLVRN